MTWHHNSSLGWWCQTTHSDKDIEQHWKTPPGLQLTAKQLCACMRLYFDGLLFTALKCDCLLANNLFKLSGLSLSLDLLKLCSQSEWCNTRRMLYRVSDYQYSAFRRVKMADVRLAVFQHLRLIYRCGCVQPTHVTHEVTSMLTCVSLSALLSNCSTTMTLTTETRCVFLEWRNVEQLVFLVKQQDWWERH